MGLISAELFEDRVYITITATGNPLLLAAPTCFEVDELGNRLARNVNEIGNGWYRVTNFTPNAAGTWSTEWAVAGANTIHYPYKIFKVDGGQEALILADTNELQTDWADGGRLDLLLDGIIADIGVFPTANYATLAAFVEDNRTRLIAIDADTATIAWGDITGIVADIGVFPTANYATLAAYVEDIRARLIVILADVTGIAGAAMRGTDAAATEAKQDIMDTNVDDIETDTSDMQPRIPRITLHMDFWSNLQEEVQIGAGDEAGVIALPDVVVADLPAGITITRSIAMYLFRALENTNAAANAVDVGTGHIEVRDDTPGAWTTAIDFPDNSLGVAGETREMGTVVIGDNDISGEVDGNDTYNFQFDDIGTDQDFLNMNDIQTGLRIYFTV